MHYYLQSKEKVVFLQQKLSAMKEYEQDENSNEIAREPAVAYEVPPILEDVSEVIDGELDIDLFYERHKEAIEAANERIHEDKTKAPKGYFTLQEFDELFKKKLSEAYAAL